MVEIKTKRILTAEERVAMLRDRLSAEEKKLQKIKRKEKDNFLKNVGKEITDTFKIASEDELLEFIEIIQNSDLLSKKNEVQSNQENTDLQDLDWAEFFNNGES